SCGQASAPPRWARSARAWDRDGSPSRRRRSPTMRACSSGSKWRGSSTSRSSPPPNEQRPSNAGHGSIERMVDGMPARGAFGRFWAAGTLSAMGTALTAVALPVLLVDDLGADALQVGIVNAAQFAPYAALGLLAGVWV